MNAFKTLFNGFYLPYATFGRILMDIGRINGRSKMGLGTFLLVFSLLCLQFYLSLPLRSSFALLFSFWVSMEDGIEVVQTLQLSSQ